MQKSLRSLYIKVLGPMLKTSSLPTSKYNQKAKTLKEGAESFTFEGFIIERHCMKHGNYEASEATEYQVQKKKASPPKKKATSKKKAAPKKK